jgi:hypothetical protein
MLEQLAGVLYIAMVVSRMVGLSILRWRAAEASTGGGSAAADDTD